MKQVFNNSEVPHIWAQQTQNEGRGSNIFFEGATIYSYGHHFPIATIKGNDVFFTMQSYSNTTAKHISRTRGAISHKNIIWVYDVPINFDCLTSVHENNLNYWKKQINSLFKELGNKKIRNIQDRVNSIQNNINQLETYCSYFKLKIKDKELKGLLKLVNDPDFINIAREATKKEAEKRESKLKQAAKVFDLFVDFWRKYDQDGINSMTEQQKSLIRFYENNQQSFTRLRFNREQNRVETSKGVQIPAEVAKRAYVQLNGCMEGSCKDISVPVMNYTITETNDKFIIAGCHTIPKEDVKYIADLLKW